MDTEPRNRTESLDRTASRSSLRCLLLTNCDLELDKIMGGGTRGTRVAAPRIV